MCMFCAALPMVAGITAVAQGEQRKKMQAQHQASLEHTATNEENRARGSSELARVERPSIRLTPRRITQLGALAFVVLLFGSGFYHSHFPG